MRVPYFHSNRRERQGKRHWLRGLEASCDVDKLRHGSANLVGSRHGGLRVLFMSYEGPLSTSVHLEVILCARWCGLQLSQHVQSLQIQSDRLWLED